MIYECCPETIQPFCISREPFAWPWCNLTASQRRPYCPSGKSVSFPVGLVGRQWDAVDWACVLCDRRIHNDRASRSFSSRQCACPFCRSRAGFIFRQNIALTMSVSLSAAQIWLPAASWFFFPKLKSPLEVRKFVNATVTHYTSSVNGVSLPTD